MKLGVITDGISRDLPHALSVMDEHGLGWAELQFIGDKEVGDLTAQEQQAARDLLRAHEKSVACLSRHIFAGIQVSQCTPFDAQHQTHLDALKRVIEMADLLACQTVRIMSPKKEMILWGANGAEKWNVANGAWAATLPLIAPAVEIARDAGVLLVVETGNGTMVNSCYTARRLIDDLGAKDVLKVLWDPANNLWCGEQGFPEGYTEVKDGYIGHIHIKDVHADPPRARLETRQMLHGQLASQFAPMADALRADGYDNVISYESVFHFGDDDYERGFRAGFPSFANIFGS
ncbi:MAG: sugar phosphate isomerase/epimerase [Pseudomonadota bacterium]